MKVIVLCPTCDGSGTTHRFQGSLRKVVCPTCKGEKVVEAKLHEAISFEGSPLPPGWWDAGEGSLPNRPRFRGETWTTRLKTGASILVFGRSVRIVRYTRDWVIDRWEHTTRTWIRCRLKGGIWKTRSLTRALETAEKVAQKKSTDTPEGDDVQTFLAWVTPRRSEFENLPHPSHKFQGRSMWDYISWMTSNRPVELHKVRRIVAQALAA